MSFTGKDVIDDARRLTNDVDKKTWSDKEDYLPVLNQVLSLLYTERPECRLTAVGALTAYAAITDLSKAVALDDAYRIAVVEYLAYRYHDSDAGEAHDADRAAEHLGRFNELIGPSK